MSVHPPPFDATAPPSTLGRLPAQARLVMRFYLGVGAPAVGGSFPDCQVRAAAGREPDMIRTLLALHRGWAGEAAGSVATINFRCSLITLAQSGERVFFKEFPRVHALHDVERALRCSRADRAWRAAHLLPGLGILTPRPVGTARARSQNGVPVEYLATEWIEGGLPYHLRLREAGKDSNTRTALLKEFAGRLRLWHDCGVYLRDLVTNVLTRDSEQGREYWLTDLDQLHPLRRLTRRRLLHQVRQLARWCGPLTPEEARATVLGYIGTSRGKTAVAMESALLTTRLAPGP
jgi:hypothetical protein